MDMTSLIHKVLTGTANDTEISRVQEWSKSDPANMQELEEMKILYLDTWQPAEGFHLNLEPGWNRIQTRIHGIERRKKIARICKTTAISIGIYAFVVFSYLIYDNSTSQSGYALSTTKQFRDMTIEEVVKTLNIDPKYKIVIEGQPGGTCRFTGAFKQGASLQSIIEILAKANDLHVRRTSGDTFVLYGRACKPASDQ